MNLKMFDAVEVHRCVRCTDPGLNEYVEILEDGEKLPEEAVSGPFWSVYLHYDQRKSEGRGLECVADCVTREWAELVALALRHRVTGAT